MWLLPGVWHSIAMPVNRCRGSAESGPAAHLLLRIDQLAPAIANIVNHALAHDYVWPILTRSGIESYRYP
ncbi:MAG: hypothetical protein HY298_21380 [Verrucomicrobia bacterium]|nr:hypothetical protein [Verrucomicrobiota bacterium]